MLDAYIRKNISNLQVVSWYVSSSENYNTATAKQILIRFFVKQDMTGNMYSFKQC